MALELGWLKRYLRTEAKWKIFPQEIEFDGIFKFGVDNISRIYDITFNPF